MPRPPPRTRLTHVAALRGAPPALLIALHRRPHRLPIMSPACVSSPAACAATRHVSLSRCDVNDIRRCARAGTWLSRGDGGWSGAGWMQAQTAPSHTEAPRPSWTVPCLTARACLPACRCILDPMRAAGTPSRCGDISGPTDALQYSSHHARVGQTARKACFS